MSAILNVVSSTGTPRTLLAVLFVPVGVAIYAKALRIERKHDHDVMMRAKFHADFMERGNAFCVQVKEAVHEKLLETEDPSWRAAFEESRRRGRAQSPTAPAAT